MAKKEDMFASFIDFKKVFDCISQDLLWNKLETKFCLSGNMLLAIKTLYEDVRCSVSVNQALTDWFNVNSGVKQGCILSPTLFAMFVDDLVQKINPKQLGGNCQTCSLSTLLYADDIVLIAPSAKKLQQLINVVAEWCSTWGINLNRRKTNVVHFHKKLRSKSRSSVRFTYNEGEVQYPSINI
jgi:hypothetical protein